MSVHICDAGLWVLGIPQMHRNIYRGKYLGDHVTDEQRAAIEAGTFDDIYVGDYWDINGEQYLVADVNYWLRVGQPEFTDNHLVVIPRGIMGSAAMNDTNTTSGGYAKSRMYTTYMEQARAKIRAAFGDLLLPHAVYLTDAVSNGAPTNAGWYNSTVDLMTETMVYGCRHFSAIVTPSNTPTYLTTEATQLALFALAPELIRIRQTYWLQDIVSDLSFACVAVDVVAGFAYARNVRGIRPAFAIGGGVILHLDLTLLLAVASLERGCAA